MADGGYKTAHFGKWHNGRTLGYEPWEMGFQESWLPTSHVHLDNLMRWVSGAPSCCCHVHNPTPHLTAQAHSKLLHSYITFKLCLRLPS